MLIVRVRKQKRQHREQRPVIQPLRRPQEQPVRSPDAAIEGEGLDQGNDKRPRILVRMRLARELVVAPPLYKGVALAADRQQRLESRLLQSMRDRRPAAMIDHQTNAGLLDQRQQRETLVVFEQYCTEKAGDV